MIRIYAVAAVTLVVLTGGGGVATAANSAAAPQAARASDAPVVTAASYLAAILPLTTRLDKEMAGDGKACSAGAAATCSAAAQVALTDGNAYKAGLDAMPVPECLKGAHNTLRDGLTMMNAGATKQLEGLRMTNADMMIAGSSDVNSGSDKVGQAALEMAHAAGTCE